MKHELYVSRVYGVNPPDFYVLTTWLKRELYVFCVNAVFHEQHRHIRRIVHVSRMAPFNKNSARASHVLVIPVSVLIEISITALSKSR